MSKGKTAVDWKKSIRRSFFSGILVVVPLAITGFILTWLFRSADSLLQPFIMSSTGIYLPGLGILVTLGGIFLVGLVARTFLAQRILRLGDRILGQVPLAGSIYGSVKQILGSFTRDDQEKARQVVLIPYPAPGLWALGFLNGTTMVDGQPSGFVLLLNSINPTTGLLTLVPMEKIRLVGISAEAAMQIIISGGIVAPERLDTVPSTGPDRIRPPHLV